MIRWLILSKLSLHLQRGMDAHSNYYINVKRESSHQHLTYKCQFRFVLAEMAKKNFFGPSAKMKRGSKLFILNSGLYRRNWSIFSKLDFGQHDQNGRNCFFILVFSFFLKRKKQGAKYKRAEAFSAALSPNRKTLAPFLPADCRLM